MNYQQQQHLLQVQQVQQQQAQVRQQMSGSQPMSPQQIMVSQSPLHQVRSPPSLPPTVRSPQPVPSPRQHTPNMVPSPRAHPGSHPSPSPQLSQTHSPHPAMATGPHQTTVSQQNPLSSEQVMLQQLGQTSHVPNQDLSLLHQQQEEVTPLTPQDQLSRFVENL